VSAFNGGDNKKGKPVTLPLPGGKIHAIRAPTNAVNAPNSAPSRIPNTDAINAVRLIVIWGSPIAGIYREKIERT